MLFSYFYRSKSEKLHRNIIIFYTGMLNNQTTYSKEKPILPKPMCDASSQTDETSIQLNVKKNSNSKILKNKICRQTQTNDNLKEKKTKKTAETQTVKTIPRIIRVHQVGKRKKNLIGQESVIRQEKTLNNKHSSEYILPDSPLTLNHDIILHNLWEEKSESGTQTSPEKDMFGDFEDYSLQNASYNGISRSDPMLTEEFYSDKYSSIETQTEKEFCRSIFESDAIGSNNKIQTTENFTETMEPLHIYSNTCTQTCNEFISSDLELSDIQTQTAWENIDESTVSTETQTKAVKCLSGCDSSSWFTIQTNHMETQTDWLSIFQDLD